ncbi:MAG: hypothetical protein NT040_13370 [Bacteroidetes bacterium]|nr:hypothetical protein [Bacteroidota bacterium]
MKTNREYTNLPPVNDYDLKAPALGADHENDADKTEKNCYYMPGRSEYPDMGEVIRRWESSRYMI